MKRLRNLLEKSRKVGKDSGEQQSVGGLTPNPTVKGDDDDEGEHGMFIFIDKPQNESGNVDIVALHGLNGHYRNTWTSTTGGKQVNWLKDMLPGVIPNARIMSFGYNSSVQFSKSTADISDFAEGLLAELMSWRTSAVEKERPVIFVCHSLGGIVFKQALVRARERDRFTNLLKKIRGVAFFGTPHAGASSAAFGQVLASILNASTFGISTNTKLVADLKNNTETLRNITKSFVDRSKALRIISFYETEKMDFMNIQVVDQVSAVLNLPNESPVPVNGNHRTMCKFSGSKADQTKFRVVWTHLKEVVDELNKVEVSYFTKLTHTEQVECLRSFYYKNYESFRNRNPDPVANTCTWFLHHHEYRNWKMNDSSSLLWVSADPGCGKSVLAKFLVEHLRLPKSEEDRPELVCHFFFKDDNDEQRSAVLALRAILHQIFTDDQALLRHTFDAFQSKGSAMVDDFESLWDILSSIASDPEATNLLFILDGLDECEKESQSKLLRSLNKIYNQKELTTKPFLKIILLSRPENIIKTSFSQNLATVRLRGEDETEAISRDVELVVRSHVNELEAQGLPRHLLLALQKALIERADRTFLWTTLMINLLKDAAIRGSSQKELQDLLENRDIYAIYCHLLARSADPGRSKKLLKLILAAARPLTLEELNVALTVNQQQLSFKELESNLRHPIENHVKALCGHFVRIVRSRVYLVHQTAREFLLRQIESEEVTHVDNWQHSVTLEECETVLLRSCVSYLFLTIAAEDENSDITRGFLDYASKFWPKHFGDTNQDASHDIFDEIVNIALHLCERSCRQADQWLFAHDLTLHLDNWRFVKHQHPASVGMHKMIDRLILQLLDDGEVSVNATDASGGTLLHYASAIGSASLVSTLLKEGAEVCAVDIRSNTPLHLAVDHYNRELGGKPHTSKQWPFLYESRTGRSQSKEIVRLLIGGGADINAVGEDDKTPLHVASECGSPEAVKLLLSYGADLNAKKADLRTALHSVADCGSIAMMEAILDQNPDLAQRDCHGDTPFAILKRRPTIDSSVASRFIR